MQPLCVRDRPSDPRHGLELSVSDPEKFFGQRRRAGDERELRTAWPRFRSAWLLGLLLVVQQCWLAALPLAFVRDDDFSRSLVSLLAHGLLSSHSRAGQNDMSSRSTTPTGDQVDHTELALRTLALHGGTKRWVGTLRLDKATLAHLQDALSRRPSADVYDPHSPDFACLAVGTKPPPIDVLFQATRTPQVGSLASPWRYTGKLPPSGLDFSAYSITSWVVSEDIRN